MTRQEILRVWLKRILPVFNEHKINYWIDFGTLLGAIRDKDVIEWDLDADISYVYTTEEHCKVLNTLPFILSSDGCCPLAAECCWDGGIKFMKHNIHIDIYPWIINGTVTKHPQRCFGIPFFPTKDIEDFKYIDFLGIQTRIPINYHSRLQRLYKNYMIPVPPRLRNKPYWGNPV